MRWADWKRAYPKGEVLSKQTGFVRDYTRDPYGDYALTPSIIFPLSVRDDRLGLKEVVYGFARQGEAKAYPADLVQALRILEEEMGGGRITVTYDEERQTVYATDAATGEELALQPSFWFSWVATWPETSVAEATDSE
jgi:hypothetical protein